MKTPDTTKAVSSATRQGVQMIAPGEMRASLTMSSREIAVLTGKTLAHVHRDIRDLINELEEDDPNLDHPREDLDARGYTVCFHLDRELTETLLTSYSAVLRRKVIARWHELEADSADPVKALNDPHKLRQVLLGYADKVIDLEHRVEVLAPKAEALDRLETGSDGSFCLTDAAKNLQVQPKKFTDCLQQEHWIYQRPRGKVWLAYQDKIRAGVLEHKVYTGENLDGRVWSSTQVRVTAKGMAKLALIVGKDQAPLAAWGLP